MKLLASPIQFPSFVGKSSKAGPASQTAASTSTAAVKTDAVEISSSNYVDKEERMESVKRIAGKALKFTGLAAAGVATVVAGVPGAIGAAAGAAIGAVGNMAYEVLDKFKIFGGSPDMNLLEAAKKGAAAGAIVGGTIGALGGTTAAAVTGGAAVLVAGGAAAGTLYLIDNYRPMS